MPTQEERLSLLEFNFDQFKSETTTYYQEMAMQVTMPKGLTEDAVKRLMQLRIQVDKRFTSSDQQLAEVKQDLAEIKQNMSDHSARLEHIETLLTQIVSRLPEKP